MSFADTVANDYKVTDGTQTVTFTAKRQAGNTALTVVDADPADYTAREVVASGGFFQAGDRRWFLGANQITGGLQPQSGDEILDAAGVRWELIADANLDDFSISWNCPTRKAR